MMFLARCKYDVPCLSLTSAVRTSAARHEEEVVRLCSICHSLMLELLTRSRFKNGFIKGKVQVNFTLEQATKTQRGSRGIAILFL
jgi:BarA-like signal transduction histidine kinase